jgi:hypothetical protein
MANSVVNQYTGASLEYRQLIQDEATFPIWNKAAANECGHLAQGVGRRIEGSNTILFIPRQAIPNGKVFNFGTDYVQQNLKFTASASLWEGTSSNIQGVYPRAQKISQLLSVSGTAPSPLKVQITCVWMSRFFTWEPQWILLNTCASPSNSSLKKSLNNTTYSPWYQMVTFILRYRKVCMPPPRPASCKPTPSPPSSRPWLPPNQIQARSMAPCHPPHSVQPCGG